MTEHFIKANLRGKEKVTQKRKDREGARRSTQMYAPSTFHGSKLLVWKGNIREAFGEGQGRVSPPHPCVRKSSHGMSPDPNRSQRQYAELVKKYSHAPRNLLHTLIGREGVASGVANATHPCPQVSKAAAGTKTSLRAMHARTTT